MYSFLSSRIPPEKKKQVRQSFPSLENRQDSGGGRANLSPLSQRGNAYEDKKFAVGCSREAIAQGAALPGWDLDELIARTLTAMQASPAVA